jgi:hypothetical protein
VTPPVPEATVPEATVPEVPVPEVPSTPTAPPSVLGAAADEAARGDSVSDRNMLAGVTGAVVLASGLAATLVRVRRRRRVQGHPRPRLATLATEERIVAAADIPFVRWASQELSALARSLSPASVSAVPVAVELDPATGIEVLWDQPCFAAPLPWEATEGGWSWRTLYDPNEPTPLAEWPAPIPGLVTIGTRAGRQLLVNIDHVGTLAVTGPPGRVEAFVRAVVLELGAGDELADASVVTVGAGVDGTEHLARVQSASVDEAISALVDARREGAGLLGGYRSLFHRRLGPDPLVGVWSTIVVCGDVPAADQAWIAAHSAAHHGAGAIVTATVDTGARVELDDSGAATVFGIAATPIRLAAVGVPRDTAAQLAVLLDDQPASDTAAADLIAACTPDVDRGYFRADASSGPAVATDDGHVDDGVVASAPMVLPLTEDGELDLEAAGAMLSAGEIDDWERPDPDFLVRVLARPAVPMFPALQGIRLRLLVFLACQRAPVTLDRVRTAVWGGVARERKTVSNALSGVRDLLGTRHDGTAYLPPATLDGGLQLDASVMTDLAVFCALTDRARSVSSNEAIELYRAALDLVEGEPFDDGGYEWASEATLGVDPHERIVAAARELYELACDAGDLVTARQALIKGLIGVPGHEDLYRLRMQLEHRCANPTAIHTAYNELTHTLAALDCEPSPTTVAVYRQLTGRRA